MITLLGLAFVAGGLFVTIYKKLFVDIVMWVNKWELLITQSLPSAHNVIAEKAKWYEKVLPGAAIWIGLFLIVLGLYLLFIY